MPGIRQRMQAEAEHGPESHYEKINSELALHLVLQILWAFVSSAQAQSLAALACKDIEAVGGTPPRNLKALANIGCGGLYVFTPPTPHTWIRQLSLCCRSPRTRPLASVCSTTASKCSLTCRILKAPTTPRTATHGLGSCDLSGSRCQLRLTLRMLARTTSKSTRKQSQCSMALSVGAPCRFALQGCSLGCHRSRQVLGQEYEILEFQISCG